MTARNKERKKWKKKESSGAACKHMHKFGEFVSGTVCSGRELNLSETPSSIVSISVRFYRPLPLTFDSIRFTLSSSQPNRFQIEVIGIITLLTYWLSLSHHWPPIPKRKGKKRRKWYLSRFFQDPSTKQSIILDDEASCMMNVYNHRKELSN